MHTFESILRINTSTGIHNTSVREMEDVLTNSYGELTIRDYATGTPLVISSVCSTVHMADISDSENLPVMLLSKVRVSYLTGMLETKQGREVDASTLAKQWNNPP